MANRKTDEGAKTSDATRVKGAARTTTAKQGSGGSVASSDAERQTVPNKIVRDAGKTSKPSRPHDAEPKDVTVTFNVTVPEFTRELKRSVFLTGTLNQLNKKIVDWSPKAQQMKRVDDRHWTVTLSGPEGTVIEYKYTLGDWEHVEQNEHCVDVSNRRVTMKAKSDQPLNINDTVSNWRNVNP